MSLDRTNVQIPNIDALHTLTKSKQMVLKTNKTDKKGSDVPQEIHLYVDFGRKDYPHTLSQISLNTICKQICYR